MIPLAEGRQHRRLVSPLASNMAAAGITVTGAEAPGWPRAPMLGARRPDVFGYCNVVGAVVAGEAKRGPELWGCLDQLRDIADALPSAGPAGAAGMIILAVGAGWEDEAAAVAKLVSGTGTAVVVWTEGRQPTRSSETPIRTRP